MNLLQDIHNKYLGNVSVIIPIHNERGNIRGILEDWSKTPFEIIVVDDGSTDEPEKVLEEFEPRIIVLKNSTNKGYGYSLKKGIHYSSGKWVLISDGDGQYAVQDACRLISFLDDYPSEERPDMAICDRRVKESPVRFIGRKVLNTIASILCRRWIPDLNSGCRIIRKDLVKQYNPLICDTFSFTTTTTMMFIIDGYTVEWLPSKILPRAYGRSKVKLGKDGWITLKQILWIGLGLRSRRLRAILRRWRESITHKSSK